MVKEDKQEFFCDSVGHNYIKVRKEKANYEQCTRCGKARFIRNDT